MENLEFNPLILEFERAVGHGDLQKACTLAELLCNKYSGEPIKITPCPRRPKDETNITLLINLVDREDDSPGEPIKVIVHEKPTILDLKRNLAHQHRYPVGKQIWIIDNALHQNSNECLENFTAAHNNGQFQATVYLLEHDIHQLDDFDNDAGPSDFNDFDSHEGRASSSYNDDYERTPAFPTGNEWICTACTMANSDNYSNCYVCMSARV